MHGYCAQRFESALGAASRKSSTTKTRMSRDSQIQIVSSRHQEMALGSCVPDLRSSAHLRRARVRRKPLEFFC